MLKVVRRKSNRLQCRCAAGGQIGAAMLEFAIVFPVFMLFVLAVFDFGFVLSKKVLVAEALSDSARLASTLETDCALASRTRFVHELGRRNGPVSGTCFRFDRDTFTSAVGVDFSVLRLSARAEMPCVFCEFFNTAIPLTETAVVPLQLPWFCNEPLFEECF